MPFFVYDSAAGESFQQEFSERRSSLTLPPIIFIVFGRLKIQPGTVLQFGILPLPGFSFPVRSQNSK